MEQFYTLLTDIGKAKIANATALQTKVKFTKILVGDSNGSYYEPTETQTKLKNKVWEGGIGNISIDKDNPNWIILESVIPSSVGGFTIREIGIEDSEGDLVVVAKYPQTYKPKIQDGSTKDLVIKMILEVSNASSVTLKVDPTVILATKKDIEILENKISNIRIPVTSVNGETGNVRLKAKDIKTEDGNTLEEFNKNLTKQVGNLKKELTNANLELKKIPRLNNMLLVFDNNNNIVYENSPFFTTSTLFDYVSKDDTLHNDDFLKVGNVKINFSKNFYNIVNFNVNLQNVNGQSTQNGTIGQLKLIDTSENVVVLLDIKSKLDYWRKITTFNSQKFCLTDYEIFEEKNFDIYIKLNDVGSYFHDIVKTSGLALSVTDFKIYRSKKVS